MLRGDTDRSSHDISMLGSSAACLLAVQRARALSGRPRAPPRPRGAREKWASKGCELCLAAARWRAPTCLRRIGAVGGVAQGILYMNAL
eukprot:1103509-Pyramimonas_sp.AAC.1